VYRPEWLWAKAVCPWPWTGAFIAANGDVVPCCRVSDPDTVCMGNVFEESFARIWNSREYQSLRDRLRNHDPPGFCINCQAAGRAEASRLACERGPTGEPPQ
jgi:radical SAM protein with 4Fe4S-binding SPASM domain